MANPVTWFEIHSKDGAKAQAFYRDVFGWNINADNPMNYGIIEAGEGGIGGGIAGGEETMVTVYVSVSDLDATLKKAESLGGRTLMLPTEVPGGPKLAMFADPDGNTIGIMIPMQM